MNEQRPSALQERLYRLLVAILLLMILVDAACHHWREFLARFPVHNF